KTLAQPGIRPVAHRLRIRPAEVLHAKFIGSQQRQQEQQARPGMPCRLQILVPAAHDYLEIRISKSEYRNPKEVQDTLLLFRILKFGFRISHDYTDQAG